MGARGRHATDKYHRKGLDLLLTLPLYLHVVCDQM